MFSDINLDLGHKVRGELVYDEQAIRQSLEMILTTSRGSRLFRPNFFSKIAAMLYEPLSENNRQRLADEIRTTVEWERRIVLRQVEVIEDLRIQGYICHIEYFIPNLNRHADFNFTLKTHMA